MNAFVLCAMLVALFGLHGLAEARTDNIASGCRVTFDTPPNYPLCTDDGDAAQITDGKYGDGTTSLWVQKCAVGWSGMSPFDTAVRGVDLGLANGLY